jgi:hypothetical protein
MAERVQQQTLSVRITDALRRRLERARQLTVSKTGEAVSTSEIAKQFLESARDDRLEVVDLLGQPTETLMQIRRKGEAGTVLTRAEWTVVAYFVRQAIERASVEASTPVSRMSLVAVLDAFLAAYALRTEVHEALDAYYLGNLPPEFRTKTSKRAGRDTVRLAVQETRRAADDLSVPWQPLLIGRNLYALLESDHLAGAEDLTRALRPCWPTLWRLAARGHYLQAAMPVRDAVTGGEHLYQPPIPSLTDGAYTLHLARDGATELSVLIGFPPARGVQYPVSGYPRLSEFRAMVATLADRHEARWSGAAFLGGVTREGSRTTTVWFRAHDNGITIVCPAEEWTVLARLVRRAWELPDVRQAWDHLALEYGDL